MVYYKGKKCKSLYYKGQKCVIKVDKLNGKPLLVIVPLSK